MSPSHSFHRFITDDGLSLNAIIYEPHIKTDALPVVCLPGLTRNARDFHSLANLIAGDRERPRRVIAIDYRGRGQSEWDIDPQNYSIAREAQDVIGVLNSLHISKAVFIGTSRGGLILHILASIVPELLAAVILNDIGPIIELEGLRHIRDYLLGWTVPHDWQEALARLKATHQAGFPLFNDNDWKDMAEAVLSETSGRIAPDFDPSLIEVLKSMDFSKSLPDLWPQFERFNALPMMVIRGEHSQLLSQATVFEMSQRHPGLISVTAAGQAHAPILHKYGIETEILKFLIHQP